MFRVIIFHKHRAARVTVWGYTREVVEMAQLLALHMCTAMDACRDYKIKSKVSVLLSVPVLYDITADGTNLR